ncbi:MAG: class I SAM-dependent methyltransferase [Actinomycetota bacterium]|nr:class I SAM-dependent methyltransferase [Actinomycetota bacterium]
MAGAVPLPPLELADRVGRGAAFDEVGRATRLEIVKRLPENWSFAGKRVLDFGCGAGRTLRHFVPEARVGEFYGCDIDGSSIGWLEENLSPPLRVFQNEETPPLPLESDSFDLVWAVSVFTHITDLWAAWLLELHRILRAGGLLFATIHGPDRSKEWAKVPEDEQSELPVAPSETDRVGMNMLNGGRSWDEGGPTVFHSEWWIREHWGRAFDIGSVEQQGVMLGPQWNGQGVVMLRKRAAKITAEELERIDPSDEREIEALRHNLRQLHHESLTARVAVNWLQLQGATENLTGRGE